MHDDYCQPTDDCRAELAIVLDEARRLLKAVRNRFSYRDAADHMDYEADRLNQTLTTVFGDPTYYPTAKVKPAPVTVQPRTRRVFRSRRVLAAAR